MREKSYFVVGFTYPKVFRWVLAQLLLVTIIFSFGFKLGAAKSQNIAPVLPVQEVKEPLPELSSVKPEPIILETSTAKDEEEERAKELAQKQLETLNTEFALQIGSFTKREKAETFLAKLAQKNPDSFQTSRIVSKKGKFTILAAESSDKKALAKKLSELQLPDSIRKNSLIVTVSKKS